MARGFLSGLIWGTAAGAVGLSVLSLAAPLPQPPDAATEAPADVDAVTPDVAEGAGVAVDGRDPDLVELPPTAPGAVDDAPDTLDPMESADTQPAALPDVAESDSALDTPEPSDAPDVAGDSGESPVAQGAPAVAPSEPGAEVGLSVSTEPAAVPELGEGGDTVATPQTPEPATETAGVDVDPEDAPVAPVPPLDAPEAPETEVELSISTEPAQPDAPDVAEDSAFASPDAGEAAPEVVTRADPEPAGDAGDGAALADAPGADAAPETPTPETPEPEPEATGPRLAGLPQIGDEPDAPEPEAQPEAEPESPSRLAPEAPSRLPTIGAGDGADSPPAAAPASGLPPIEAFAEPFDNPADLPLMAIILIDGPDSVGAEALADFPYPLTFAIDPTQPDAAERMRARRDAGFEVVALVDLPAAAQPADAEVALAAGMGTMDQAVALLEGTGTGIQGNRALSDQVTEIVAQTGHGLITQDNGLNTVPKLAEREGVPTAIVFRDFDGAGQSPTVMRRFLDQAAFRAGQQGAVVMLGRVQPDTVSALLLWGLQDRAARVALAPITAVLTKVH